ncbi:MAG: hypothetical protein U0136_10415 [Bdellovibrionota bacterium]
MFQGVYLIWFLLPFMLTLLSGWALLKPVFKIEGREYAGDHFVQALFCWFAFAISIAIDQSFLVSILDLEDLEKTDPTIVLHWVLFPVVLVALAYVQKLFSSWLGKGQKDELSFGLARYKR